MQRTLARVALATVMTTLALTTATTSFAQEATPTPTPTPPPAPETATEPEWLTGDELRRELQLIRFDFRVDGASGDWLGWAPRADGSEAPALRLDGDGTTHLTPLRLECARVFRS